MRIQRTRNRAGTTTRPVATTDELVVKLQIRATPYGSDKVNWYDMSAEVQKALDNYFGGRFIERGGSIVHIGLVIEEIG